jgi:hypothetical protein
MTTYTHLNDQELLNSLDDARHYSPVIGELCRRLEAKGELESAITGANHRAECPICKGPLTVDYDAGNGLFELRIDK